MLSQRLDKQDLMLGEIRGQVLKTNGRVTALEVRDAVREGVREERATELEERRKERAADLQRYMAYRAWMRPALAGSTGALVVGVALRLMF